MVNKKKLKTAQLSILIKFRSLNNNFFNSSELTLYNHTETMALVALLISKLGIKEISCLKTSGVLNAHAQNAV